MRFKWWLWSWSLMATLTLHAQLQLELSTDQTQFLPGEKLLVTVRIINQTGRTLKLATQPDWLVFTVESFDGRVVSKRREVPVEGAFELEAASRGSFRVNIAPHFELETSGRYRVTAQMKVPELSQVISAPPALFDIVEGSKLWSQTVGLPPKDGKPDGELTGRRYLLQQANHLKQLRLYLRITDANELETLSVVPLGGMVSFNPPQPLVDSQSRLHILHQLGARNFVYHLISTDGELLQRRSYDIAESRPKLRVNESGEVLVIGGVRRFDSSDFPAPDRPNAKPASAPK